MDLAGIQLGAVLGTLGLDPAGCSLSSMRAGESWTGCAANTAPASPAAHPETLGHLLRLRASLPSLCPNGHEEEAKECTHGPETKQNTRRPSHLSSSSSRMAKSKSDISPDAPMITPSLT